MTEFFADYPAVLALVIYVARILDVSIGTLRTILVFRGHRMWSAALGFFEILIWLLAASQVLQNLDTWYLALAYAGGFATGNFVGMVLENKLALGSELVRVVSANLDVNLANGLRQDGVSVTELPGRGDDGELIEVLFIVERRRKVPPLLRKITELDPKAVWTVSDVKSHLVAPRISNVLSGAAIKLK